MSSNSSNALKNFLKPRSQSNLPPPTDKEKKKNNKSIDRKSASPSVSPVTRRKDPNNFQFGSYEALLSSKKPVSEIFRSNIDDSKKQLAIKNDLDSLLNLIELEQMEIRYLVSEIVSSLTETDGKLKISENGWSALALIARNIDDTADNSDVILTEISWTLLVLASREECQKDFTTFIEWQSLLRLANCDIVDVKSNICAALGYLALIPEESKIILKTFGELLIFSGKVTRHLRVRETVASTLANLSLNEENAIIIFDKALELLLLWLMESVQHQKLLTSAVNTVANIILLGDEKRNRFFVEKNGLIILAKLLNSDNSDLIKTVTICISTLALMDDMHTRMFKLGMIDRLIHLGKTMNNDVSVLMGVLLAIHNLALNMTSRAEMLKSVHLIDMLIDIEKKSTEISLKNQATQTIKVLTSTESPKKPVRKTPPENVDTTLKEMKEESPVISRSSSSSSLNSEPCLSRSGSFGPLANTGQYWRVRKSNSSNDMQKGSSGRLSWDVQSDEKSEVLYPGVLSELVTALEENPDIILTFLKHEHVAKLKQLARLNVSRQIQLAGHGAYDAIPSLVLLLFCNEEKIKALTLDVITLVADNNEDNQERILSSQGFKIILDLVFLPGANSTGAISLKAIGALAALSTNNKKVSRDVRDSGLVSKLIDLVKSNNIHNQKNGAIAISAFCETDSETQNYVMKNGGVNPIINMLLSNTNADVVKAIAAATLTSIVKYNAKLQNFIMGQKGMFNMIVKLLESKDLDVKIQVCALVMELCRDNEKCQKAIWEEGVGEPLMNILQSIDLSQAYLVYNCSGAVWVLSKKKKRRRFFTERGALVALTSLAQKIASRSPQKVNVQKAVDQTIAVLSKDIKKKTFL